MVRYLLAVLAAQAVVPPPPPPPPVTCDPFMLFFDEDSAALTSGSRRMIDKIASVKANLKLPIRVVGYTDAPGSEDYNLALSRQRAEAVRMALIAKGVPADAIIVGARGETGFLVETDAAEAQNRRVQVSECEEV